MFSVRGLHSANPTLRDSQLDLSHSDHRALFILLHGLTKTHSTASCDMQHGGSTVTFTQRRDRFGAKTTMVDTSRLSGSLVSFQKFSDTCAFKINELQ